MILARIVGTVVATRKDPRLVSNKLLVARPIDPQGKPEGHYLVAVDTAARGGSLAIDLDLRVHAPGHYQFFADVLAADGATPIGWITPHWTELAKGSSRVELSLFGKVLRDRGIPGPYVIANLRAVKRAGDVDEAAWWSDPRSFTTDRFALEDFSPEPWDGAERRDTIAALQASIAEQEAAERGAGQP